MSSFSASNPNFHNLSQRSCRKEFSDNAANWLSTGLFVRKSWCWKRTSWNENQVLDRREQRMQKIHGYSVTEIEGLMSSSALTVSLRKWRYFSSKRQWWNYHYKKGSFIDFCLLEIWFEETQKQKKRSLKWIYCGESILLKNKKCLIDARLFFSISKTGYFVKNYWVSLRRRNILFFVHVYIFLLFRDLSPNALIFFIVICRFDQQGALNEKWNFKF